MATSLVLPLTERMEFGITGQSDLTESSAVARGYPALLMLNQPAPVKPVTLPAR